jgi:cytochrome c-type biogenesis protein CcmH/NrfG
MAKKNEVGSEYVKKETMLLVAFIALVVGFMGGIVFSVFKSDSKEPVQAAAPQPQVVEEKGPTPEQTGMILALEKETSLNPKNEEAWIQLGDLYFDTNQLEKAIKAYSESLKLNPNNANVMTDMGVMYRRNGQPAKAVEAFDKAVKIDPRHEISRFNKGIVLMHDLQDQKGALQAWEELVKINPIAKAPNGQPIKELVEKLKEQVNQQ